MTLRSVWRHLICLTPVLSLSGCIWVTCRIEEEIVWDGARAGASQAVDLKVSSEFVSDGRARLKVTQLEEIGVTGQARRVRSPNFDVSFRSWCIHSLTNDSGFGLLFVPIDLVGDFAAPPLVGVYSILKGIFGSFDGEAEPERRTEQREVPAESIVLTNAKGDRLELSAQPPEGWTVDLEELRRAGLDPRSVTVTSASQSKPAKLPVLPAGTPDWFADLPSEHRPPLPLPAGIRFGANNGEYTNAVDGSVLVWVRGGSFAMGHEGFRDTRPVRRVEVSGFFMGKYEVTWSQMLAFCRAKGIAEPPRSWTDNKTKVNYTLGEPNHPANGISWQTAVAYCQWAGLRLPTEAEWEYAARGTDGRLWPGEGQPGPTSSNFGLWDGQEVPDYRNGADGHLYTAPVGAFRWDRSPFGCMDMAGNVKEWVADWFASDYGPDQGPVVNPRGPTSGELRAGRGGCWMDSPRFGQAYYRTSIRPETCQPTIGFRVAR